MPTPTYKAGTGYWTDGPVDPKTNTVGTGQWIEGGTAPTVITNANTVEKTIPTIVADSNKYLGTTPTPTNTTDTTKSTDPTLDYLLSEQKKANTATDSAFSEDKALLASMKSAQDAAFNAQLDQINSFYSSQENALRESQANISKGLGNLMETSGTNRTSDESGILSAKKSYDIQQLNELHNEEMRARLGLMSAKNTNDYQAMAKNLELAQKARKDKQDFADKIIAQQIEQKKEERKVKLQVAKDNAVAKVYSSGIKDPNAILNELNKGGGNFTLKDVDDSLKVLHPSDALSGLDSDYRTYTHLQEIGDPAVKGLTYLQFKTAVSNATKKATGGIEISNEKKTTLLGAGFSQNDIVNIEKDVQTHGLDKVLEGIQDKTQKKALQDAYGVKAKVTRAQLDTTVTQKMAQDGLKETYTTDELKELADKKGLSSFWTGAASDIDRFLNSAEAKKVYADLLWEQYKSAGMAEE